jgi:hypothetical protein
VHRKSPCGTPNPVGEPGWRGGSRVFQANSVGFQGAILGLMWLKRRPSFHS